MGSEAVGEFGTIVCLDAFNRTGEGFYQMLKEHSGGIGTMLLKSLHKTPAGKLINGCVLEETLASQAGMGKTDGRNEFNINLNALSGMIHLLVGFRDVFGILGFDSHHFLLPKETIQSCNRAGIAPLAKLDPEDNQTCIRISAAHITNEFRFGVGMLIGMVKRSSGVIPKGVNGAVITAFPTVDILAVGLVFDGRLRNTIFICVINKG